MRLIDRLRGVLEARHDIATIDDYIAYQGHQYPLGVPGFQVLADRNPQPAIPTSFPGYAAAFRGNAVVWALEQIRAQVFSSVRFQWQAFTDGRPGRMFSTPALGPLNEPDGPESLQDLLMAMLLTADLAGTAYFLRRAGQLVWLNPGWVDVVFEARPGGVGQQVKGYLYWDGGRHSGAEAEILMRGEVASFSPMPDPEAPWRGMSWLTPVLREVWSDNAARDHKAKFFENGAVPGLAVSLKESVSPEEFAEFMSKMDEAHGGVENAYRTLYLGGGADVTVVGADLKQIDFKSTQGHGETRLAMAAGVPAVVLGSSEGMQGSSLNAGNYGQARRRFADGTMHPLWQNAAASLQNVFPPPDAGSRLWYDARDVPFLREDAKDQAEIFGLQARAARQLLDAGYTAESVSVAINTGDMTTLEHTGLFSVQLQRPGSGAAPDDGGQQDD